MLRQLALRRTAERVDADVQAYREEHAIRTTWPTSDRILVCVGPAPTSARLVRAARRMAAGLRAPWVAVYVETPGVALLGEADHERLEGHRPAHAARADRRRPPRGRAPEAALGRAGGAGGADAGADDYLTKPFGVKEPLARVRVALRHGSRASTSEPETPVIELGDVRLDRARREVWHQDAELHLTPTEYKLLCLFAVNAGRVLTRRQILREVWGPNSEAQTHYVRVHVAELRKKIERDPARPELLLIEPGVGYRPREPAVTASPSTPG